MMATEKMRGFWHRNLIQMMIGLVASVPILLLLFALKGKLEAAGMAMDRSDKVATVVGVMFGCIGLCVIGARLGVRFLTGEQAEDIKAHGSGLIYSAIAMLAMGLLLILLGFAGPGGIIKPVPALIGSLFLLALAS